MRILFKQFNIRSQRHLIFIALTFALAGLVELFDPLDLAISGLSNKVRAQQASGQVVLVSLDDYAQSDNLSGFVSDKDANYIVKSLLNSGAKKIFISEPVLSTNQNASDSLEETLRNNSENVFLVEPQQHIISEQVKYSNEFITSAIAPHNQKTMRYWGGVEEVEYTIEYGGNDLISAESALTGVYGKVGAKFPIDYSIDVQSIPLVKFPGSEPSALTADVADKLIIAGFVNAGSARNARILGDHNWYRRATMTALATETLYNGRPITINSMLSIVLALPFLWFILNGRRVTLQISTLIISTLIIFGIQVALADANMVLATSHAIIMLIGATPVAIYNSVKAKTIARNQINPVSGLPALNQLSYSGQDPRPLIVANIVEFEELMGILAPEQRKNLSTRIAALATSDGNVWHGENGHFYWFLPPTRVEQLSAHLEGLNLILRNGFSVGELPISMTGIFGVDLRSEADMSDRIIGANVSAKRAAENSLNWLIYEAGDKSETEWTITRQRELNVAIEAGQISADLQPKIDLRTGEIVGFEALARWTHPQRGQIRPDEFIQAAEDGGCIKELTVAVAHSAFRSFRHAIDKNPNQTIAINITPSLLANKNFGELISSLLAYHDISPYNLVLEVTESTAFTNNETSINSMHELVAMGVTLSIDDYGTGNSTLEYMRKIPAGELKIDRTFISHLLTSEEDQMLIKSTIRLAQELNMVVVAEGVEDNATLRRLSAMGCDFAQGYLISRPLSYPQFVDFIGNTEDRSRLLNAG